MADATRCVRAFAGQLLRALAPPGHSGGPCLGDTEFLARKARRNGASPLQFHPIKQLLFTGSLNTNSPSLSAKQTDTFRVVWKFCDSPPLVSSSSASQPRAYILLVSPTTYLPEDLLRRSITIASYLSAFTVDYWPLSLFVVPTGVCDRPSIFSLVVRAVFEATCALSSALFQL